MKKSRVAEVFPQLPCKWQPQVGSTGRWVDYVKPNPLVKCKPMRHLLAKNQGQHEVTVFVALLVFLFWSDRVYWEHHCWRFGACLSVGSHGDNIDWNSVHNQWNGSRWRRRWSVRGGGIRRVNVYSIRLARCTLARLQHLFSFSQGIIRSNCIFNSIPLQK